jgi:hypothetical protein
MVLPNWIDRMEQMASTAGASVAAGLPNITGEFNPRFITQRRYESYTHVGALSYSNADYSGNSQPGGGHNSCDISFDASLSSPIYGNSDTVQPPAIKQIPILRY